MKNVTLALDEQTLNAGRAYAQRHQTTLNALVRDLLVKTVVADRQAAVDEMFRLERLPIRCSVVLSYQSSVFSQFSPRTI